MKLHTIGRSIVVACAAFCSGLVFASEDVEYTSSQTVTPGVWNSNFAISLEYATARCIPIVMYYGVYECGFAERGVQVLKQQVVKDWFAAKKVVMIYKRVKTKEVNSVLKVNAASKCSDPDLWLGDNWVVNNSNVNSWPIMRVYWNMPNGQVVSKTFSLRNKKMPVTTPTGSSVEAMAAQFVGTLEKYFGDYVPGEYEPSESEEEDDPEEDESEDAQEDQTEDDESDEKDDAPTVFGTMALSYQGYIADGNKVAGVISVTAQKAMSNGKVKVSGKVTTILGKNYAFSAQTTQAEHAISLKNKNIGQINILFSDDAMAGTVDGCNIVSGSTIGGFLPGGTGTFILGDTLPETNGVYTIVHDALPTNEVLTITATRMKAGKSGSVKWNSKTKSIDVSEVNPSALLLTYSSSTGLFKGSFKVYRVKPRMNSHTGAITGVSLTKLSASVSGFVIDGVGIGQATIKGFDPLDISIRFDGTSDE